MKVQESLEQHLIEILENQIECNSQLFELMRRERESIVHNDFEKLESANLEKMTVKSAIEQLENERQSLMPRFIQMYQMQQKVPRLDDIINVVKEPFKSIYKEKQAELKKLLHHMQIAQAANKKLIQKSLSFHERSFNLLYRLTNQNLGYGAQGEIKHAQTRLIDSVG